MFIDVEVYAGDDFESPANASYRNLNYENLSVKNTPGKLTQYQYS